MIIYDNSSQLCGSQKFSSKMNLIVLQLSEGERDWSYETADFCPDGSRAPAIETLTETAPRPEKFPASGVLFENSAFGRTAP